MQEHVASMCRSAAQSLYALQLFKVHGMDFQSLCTVCKALVVAKLTYASTAWWGFATNENRQSLQAVLNRATRRGFYKSSDLSIEQHCRARDLKLFSSVLHNPSHVLHHLLPPPTTHTHNLRPRGHNRQLPIHNSTLNSKNFLSRMLYQTI